MWLILSETGDSAASWLTSELKTRNLQDVRLVVSHELGPGARWHHRVKTGTQSIDVELLAGWLRGRDITGVVNRLSGAWGWHFPSAENSNDAEYAQNEVYAFFLSWLQALPAPMLGRPSPPYLAGRHYRPAEWAYLAARSNLRFENSTYYSGAPELSTPRPAHSNNSVDRRVFVIGTRAIGDAPTHVLDSCVRLAQLSMNSLLGINFRIAGGGDLFISATPTPDLRLGGSGLVDCIASYLQSEAPAR